MDQFSSFFFVLTDEFHLATVMVPESAWVGVPDIHSNSERVADFRAETRKVLDSVGWQRGLRALRPELLSACWAIAGSQPISLSARKAPQDTRLVAQFKNQAAGDISVQCIKCIRPIYLCDAAVMV